MARVEKVKARKDYPAQGIKKGDEYYICRIKLQRGGMTIRSKDPIPRYRTTVSEFYSTLWQIEDEAFSGVETSEQLRDVATQVRELGEAQQEKLDNMPEGLQEGSTGEMLRERAEACEAWADEIEQAAETLDEKLSAIDEHEKMQETYDQTDESGGAPEEWDEGEFGEIGEFDAEQARADALAEAIEEAEQANPGIS